MGWDAMVDSFQQAQAFFHRYHAGQPFAALVVNTWFMDPRLAELLPAEANPIQLQRAAYLYPVPPAPDGLWFVFLHRTTKEDIATLPRDTTLQRQLAAFLEAGRTWHGGGMFMLPREMLPPRAGLYRDRFHQFSLEYRLEDFTTDLH